MELMNYTPHPSVVDATLGLQYTSYGKGYPGYAYDAWVYDEDGREIGRASWPGVERPLTRGVLRSRIRALRRLARGTRHLGEYREVPLRVRL